MVASPVIFMVLRLEIGWMPMFFLLVTVLEAIGAPVLPPSVIRTRAAVLVQPVLYEDSPVTKVDELLLT
jgi:hypothetical protein